MNQCLICGGSNPDCVRGIHERQGASAQSKVRKYLVDDIVRAANNLVLYDLALNEAGVKMPAWYGEAISIVDETINGVQDALEGEYAQPLAFGSW